MLNCLRDTNKSVTELKEAPWQRLSEADSAWMSIVDFTDIDAAAFWSPQAHEDVRLEELQARAAVCTDMQSALSTWHALQTTLKDALETPGAPVVRAFEDDRHPSMGLLLHSSSSCIGRLHAGCLRGIPSCSK